MSDWKYSDLMAQLIAVARRDELTDVLDIYAFVDHQMSDVWPIGHPDSRTVGAIYGFARDRNYDGYVFLSLGCESEPTVDDIEAVPMWRGFQPEWFTHYHETEVMGGIPASSTAWDVYPGYEAALGDESVSETSDVPTETAENDLADLFG